MSMTKRGWSHNNEFTFCNNMLANLKNAENDIPESFYMFGETHWGGCGCIGGSYGDSRVAGVALGFKFEGEVIYIYI